MSPPERSGATETPTGMGWNEGMVWIDRIVQMRPATAWLPRFQAGGAFLMTLFRSFLIAAAAALALAACSHSPSAPNSGVPPPLPALSLDRPAARAGSAYNVANAGGAYRYPVPRQEIVDTIGGMAVRHALEHVFEVGVGLDPVELCRGEKRGDDGPSIRAAVRPGEEMVFASQSHRPDGTFHRIGVEFDAAIIQEPAERRPARERIADGLGQPAAVRNAAKLDFEPGLHRLDERPCVRLARSPACFGRLAADAFLDGIELGDPAQGLGGDRRAGGLVELIELASDVGPAGGRTISPFAASVSNPA